MAVAAPVAAGRREAGNAGSTAARARFHPLARAVSVNPRSPAGVRAGSPIRESMNPAPDTISIASSSLYQVRVTSWSSRCVTRVPTRRSKRVRTSSLRESGSITNSERAAIRVPSASVTERTSTSGAPGGCAAAQRLDRRERIGQVLERTARAIRGGVAKRQIQASQRLAKERRRALFLGEPGFAGGDHRRRAVDAVDMESALDQRHQHATGAAHQLEDRARSLGKSSVEPIDLGRVRAGRTGGVEQGGKHAKRGHGGAGLRRWRREERRRGRMADAGSPGGQR